MSFWNRSDKGVLNSREYESLAKKITELSSELQTTQIKFKVLQQDLDNLRGNFNRKVNKKFLEKPDEVEDESKDINNSVILPYDGNPFKRQ
jgi:DNA gyrase/topoisomerase IV subunit A